MRSGTSLFIETLQGNAAAVPPIWFMRQAGRYLPEYRAVRAEAGGFLDLCYNPDKATAVTMQPIDRYDLDAAILFADILLVPQALGMKLWFETGEGPKLSPPIAEALKTDHLSVDGIHDTLGPVYESVAQIRAALPDDKALIGFAGAPWTVATYMLAGAGSKDPSALRRTAYEHPEVFWDVIDKVSEATTQYLFRQIAAGANAVMLFDSWAAGLPEAFFRKACLAPVKKIYGALKAAHPDIPLIAFPRGAGPLYPDIAALDCVDGVSIDSGIPAGYAAEAIAPHAVVQGGLDQLLLLKGGDEMYDAAEALLTHFKGKPYIFNTGHGLIPETPPENVGKLVEFIRTGKRT